METTNGFSVLQNHYDFTRYRSIYKTVTTTWVIRNHKPKDRQYNGKKIQQNKTKQSKTKQTNKQANKQTNHLKENTPFKIKK